jgi:hypothetical protein
VKNVKLSSALRLALVTTLAGGGVAALPATTAQAAVVQATLVKTTWTGGPNSNWAHPSPDPSGIAYNSRTGQLIIGDGEVEETGSAYPKNVWMGTNLFITNLQGQLLETGTNTTAYSPEPVGVGFRPALSADFPERMFVSDDDQDRVFEVDRGADGRYGTADDTQTSVSTRFTGSSRDDAEDVAVVLGVTQSSELLIIDGVGQEVYVYSPGPNKRFDGLPAVGGDDTVRQFDVYMHGARDPEGIAYNPYRDTIFVLDDPSNQILEFNMQGELLNLVALPFKMGSGAGITLAPPSNGSGGAPNAYIVDRGVDNDTNQDTFNDGRLYEVAIPGLTGAGSGGTGTAPPPSPAGVLRYSHNFNADTAADVIAARSDGALLLYPGNGRGNFLGGATQIGAGWQARDMIRHAQDFDRNGTRDVIARDPGNGSLWLYKGNGQGGFSGQSVIGQGWNTFSEIVAPGDWNGDGNPDLVTVRSSGAMNLYPGNGAGGFGSSYPQIGAGFQSRDQIISVGDWDGDGRNDLVARDRSNGDLWLYAGNGTGGFKTQRVIGSGWGIFNALVGPGDWDGNGTNDILARRSNGDLYLYPGDGRGGFLSNYPKFNSGWSSLRIASAGQQ